MFEVYVKNMMDGQRMNREQTEQLGLFSWIQDVGPK